MINIRTILHQYIQKWNQHQSGCQHESGCSSVKIFKHPHQDLLTFDIFFRYRFIECISNRSSYPKFRQGKNIQNIGKQSIDSNISFTQSSREDNSGYKSHKNRQKLCNHCYGSIHHGIFGSGLLFHCISVLSLLLLHTFKIVFLFISLYE